MRIERWRYTVPLRLRSLLRSGQADRDLDEELQYHLDRQTEELIARGLKPDQARAAALRSMQGLTQRKEECRDTRRVKLVEDTVRDVRYAVRLVGKSPGFFMVAIVTLALAIGANAIAFAALNAAILRPLNVPRPESLYSIHQADDNSAVESYPGYVDFRDRNRSFEDLAAYYIAQVGLETGGDSARAITMAASGNYFEVLGITPYLGRLFHVSDEKGPNSAPYIVLSHAYWQSRFQADPDVVGRVVKLNKHPFTIIGVAPAEFTGTLLFFSPDFFIPIVSQEQLDGRGLLNRRDYRWVSMTLGHLKPGVTPAQAASDLTSISASLAQTYPKESKASKYTLGRPGLYGDYFGRPVRAFASALMLLAGLILLAACANLGSLFAARAADRAREVALRLALGAGRMRIVRQLITEAMLIALAGGALGLWGSVLLLRWLAAWHPFPQVPLTIPLNPDANVYAVALLLALASGFIFAAAQIRQVLRTDPYTVAKAGQRCTRERRITARELSVVVQIAICAVLVTSSIVAVRGLVRSMHTDLGFEPRNALLIETALNLAGYRGGEVALVQQRMMDAVRRIPGVTSAAMIDSPPLSNSNARTVAVFTDGTTDFRQANVAATVCWYRASPEYLQASGTPLLAGRDFSLHNNENARVAIANQEFARKVLGSDKDAVGRHFKMSSGTRIEVVGMVPDGKHQSLTEETRPAMFFPPHQATPATATWIVVRFTGDPAQLAADIRGRLRELTPGLPVFIQSWNEGLNLALFPARAATVALGILGILGAMLSVTGVFGMAAYSVGTRMRELGIRMAMGAQRRQVLGTALGRAFRLLAAGSVAGLAVGLLASRVLASIVYQATPRDPLVMAGVIASMAILGLLATWIPAQRALSLDPATLLREE